MNNIELLTKIGYSVNNVITDLGTTNQLAYNWELHKIIPILFLITKKFIFFMTYAISLSVFEIRC